MHFAALISTCYPHLRNLTDIMRYIPLSARSLLVKTCQGQHNFDSTATSPLFNLLDAHLPVTVQLKSHHIVALKVWEILPHLSIHIADPLASAIVLDVLRSYPVEFNDSSEAINKGWYGELTLIEKSSSPEIDFLPLFYHINRPIHHLLPYNFTMAFNVRRTFERFREHLIHNTPRYFARATHKNMSQDTRREYEMSTGISLEGVAIFGQDDWCRHYYQTSEELGGAVEMRQRWPPSVMKPRTYFAMGGHCYRSSRFLQEFFTDIVNRFLPTNHISRLNPSRLHLSPDPMNNDHYLVYDLSSFTSNMQEQKEFCSVLASFMDGVIVELADEVAGLIEVDLGELLREYNEACVDYPVLSLERTPDAMGLTDVTSIRHLRASLLGIFGNLMTCTLSHYLILSPTIDDVQSINVAGDDGLVLEDETNSVCIQTAIGLVGACAPEKTSRSNDEGCVCLKRPLFENRPHLRLDHNLVPPNLATAASYLYGESVDPRFQMFGLEIMTVGDRISVVGKDLMRFFRSCYTLGYDDLDGLSRVYMAFKRMAISILDFDPPSGGGMRGRDFVIWPVDPRNYDFASVDPVYLYCFYNASTREFAIRDVQSFTCNRLRYAGDIAKGNSDKRLVMLERLQLIEKEECLETLDDISSVSRLYSEIVNAHNLPPVLYQYTCLTDVPDHLLFD